MPKRIIIPKNVVNPNVTTVIEIPDELQNVSPLIVNRSGQDSSLGDFPSELAQNLSDVDGSYPEFDESPPNINTSAYQSSSGGYPSAMMSNLTDYSYPESWGNVSPPSGGLGGYDSSAGNYPSELMENMSDPYSQGSPGLPWSQEYSVSHPRCPQDETYIVERPDMTRRQSPRSPVRQSPQDNSLGILQAGDVSPGFQNQGTIEGLMAIPLRRLPQNLASPMRTPPGPGMFNPTITSTPIRSSRAPRSSQMGCRRKLQFCRC